MRLREFARERIFGPLGMTASTIGCDEALLTRWGEVPGHFLTRELVREIDDDGSMMLFSTARDIAAFCQMFLNGGTYGGHRLLSEWTVHEMTRNQIPGVGCVDFYGRWVAEASWGLGWTVQGDARWPYSQGFLTPRGSYLHQGGGGTAMWVDPQHNVVGVYLTTTRLDPVTHNPNFEFDKFQNMVTAAVDHVV